MKSKIYLLISIVCLALYLKISLSSYIGNTFPFSESTNVDLVFYKKEQLSSDLTKFNKIPLKKSVRLNENEKKEIFEILFNTTCFIEVRSACYYPRHAIVFTKAKDTLGIIEVCLECSHSRVTEGIDRIEMCDRKVEKLDSFFKSKE